MRRPSIAWALGALMLALPLASPAFAPDEQPADHRLLVPLKLAVPEGLQRVKLPLAVLQASRTPALGDLRVFNANGESLPLALMPMHDEQAAREATLPLFTWPAGSAVATTAAQVQVRVNAQGAVLRIDGAPARPAAVPGRHWLVDLGEPRQGERLDALLLDWDPAPEGLTRRLRVEGSGDLAEWQPLGQAVLVDLPGGAQPRVLRNRWSAEGAPRPPRYLRIGVDDRLPLRMVRARWVTAQGPALDSSTLPFARSSDADVTAWEVDLKAPLALRRLQLALPQPNSIVLVAVEQRANAEQPWRAVAHATVYRLTQGGQALQSPPIELGAQAARHWRLRLEPGSPSLAASSLAVELQWPVVGVAFLARAPGPLKLAIGRERAAAQALPIGTLVPGWKPGVETTLPEAALGEPTPQEPSEPGWWDRLLGAQAADRRRWGLWLVLAGAVALLAWLARGLWKDLGQAPR